MEELRRYTSTGVHKKVLDCMGGFKKGLVLDVPSGQGAMPRDLEKLGFKVFLGDFKKENMHYRNGRCTQLDLNELLPFKEGVFDYVTCVAGIEHLENPHHLTKEFSRLIKREGVLVITTPNVMTIRSRLKFLFYSYFESFRYIGPLPSEQRQKLKDLGLGFDFQHINPISYSEMKFILEKYGFKIERIEANRMVRKWKMIYPFLKWLIKYLTKKKIQKDPLLISNTLLEGEHLIFIAKQGEQIEV
jgi:ubiquinone/menaquinone biosynthesis C-methylase UbiE